MYCPKCDVLPQFQLKQWISHAFSHSNVDG